MRFFAAIFVLLAVAAWAQTSAPPTPAPPVPAPVFQEMRECSNHRTVQACNASQEDLKKAAQEFSRALKLQKEGKPDEAIFAFEEAARLVPRDMEYVTAHAVARQQAVYRHIEAGNNYLSQNKKVEANAEFRQALQLDPSNTFALQQLAEAVAPEVPAATQKLRVMNEFGELRVEPRNIRQSFHIKGDTRALYTAIGNAFGVTFEYDDSVEVKPVRFDVDDADFYTAAKWAGLSTKTFWVPLSSHQALLASDTPANTSNSTACRCGLSMFPTRSRHRT
jgi:tetratricopeptide (TPR) repeat protein